jgi:succinate dehydrogenase/fumarate reductase flavoprotein subunit
MTQPKFRDPVLDLLRKELRDAERALGEEPTEENFAWLRDVQGRLNNRRITKKVDNLRMQAMAVAELQAELKLAEYVLSRYLNENVFAWLRDIQQRMEDQGAVGPLEKSQENRVKRTQRLQK